MVGITLLQEPAEVSSLLCYPVAIRMFSDAGDMYTSSSNSKKEENVYGFQEQRLNGQKISGQELTLVVIHEVSPS